MSQMVKTQIEAVVLDLIQNIVLLIFDIVGYFIFRICKRIHTKISNGKGFFKISNCISNCVL